MKSKWTARVTGLSAILGLGAFAGCGDDSSDSCSIGKEGCACYGNGTCDAHLTCASKLCVSLGADAGTGGAATGGKTSTGGSPGSGGVPNTGGMPGNGGVPNTGGLGIGTGGTSSGGRSASGGAKTDAGADGGSTGFPDGGDPGDGGISRVDVDRCSPAQVQNIGVATDATSTAYLYPYGGTVFPRGLPPPVLMWSATNAASAAMVEIKSKNVSYRTCATIAESRLELSPEDWREIEKRNEGKTDPVKINLVVKIGATSQRLPLLTIELATAPLGGVVYYDSYDDSSGAPFGVQKLALGEKTSSLYLTDTGIPPMGPCRSCHSVSANGAAMTVNHHLYPGILYESELYDVIGGKPTLIKAGVPETGNAAIFPDGSRYVTNGAPNDSQSAFMPTAPGNAGMVLKSTSKLFDMRTGTALVVTSWTAPHAQMPSFSLDGAQLVYNDYDLGSGHALRVADFSAATNAFSNYRDLFSDTNLYPGWPTFTPDGKKVLFALGSRSDFTSQTPDIFGPPTMTPTGRSHLVVVDVATKKFHAADLSNGYLGQTSYLPKGAARDNDLDFYPALSPVAAGGYYWVFFTSRRTYGNESVLGLEDPQTKKIWVAAIDPAAPAGTDPSRPAFLLPGQNMQGRNFRPTHVPAP